MSFAICFPRKAGETDRRFLANTRNGFRDTILSSLRKKICPSAEILLRAPPDALTSCSHENKQCCRDGGLDALGSSRRGFEQKVTKATKGKSPSFALLPSVCCPHSLLRTFDGNSPFCIPQPGTNEKAAPPQMESGDKSHALHRRELRTFEKRRRSSHYPLATTQPAAR
jgi:hypothetical protein